MQIRYLWFFLAVSLSAASGYLLLTWSITGFGAYGYGVFLFLPLNIGAAAAYIQGWKAPVTRWQSAAASLAALGLFALLVFAFAQEGVICLLMAAPLAVPFAILGALLVHSLRQRRKAKASLLLSLFFLVPASFPLDPRVDARKEESGRAEGQNRPGVASWPDSQKWDSVVTRITVQAEPSRIWEKVIAFPPLPPPDEWFFRAGIAYPTHARLIGEGPGALRECHFSTGVFVEPITRWEKPHLLEFDVSSQPEPLRELSFRAIHPPHLHGYFESKKGRFRIREENAANSPSGRTVTVLEGTTWYRSFLAPKPYWRLWNEYLVHRIHLRVLGHIRDLAEMSP